MGFPPQRKRTALSSSVTNLVAWVAAFGSLAGLIDEIVRSKVILVGCPLVIYLIYVSFSVRAFWTVPRIVIPITLALGGTLWTLAIQRFDHGNVLLSVTGVLFVPIFMAFLIRSIFPGMVNPVDQQEAPGPPSTIRLLLSRRKGFGRRSSLVQPPSVNDF